ncbi:MAG: flap endonuclease-1 [Candidatus Hydrothermarchaeota archaeon]
MGVSFGDIIPKHEIDFDHLKDKEIAIDAMNSMYQFLSIIRQPDGTPLKDSRGRVTSHLSGLFYRTINLIEKGIKPIYVFDGEPPRLKSHTIEERVETRKKAQIEWKKALEVEDFESARKHAQAALRLDEYMIESSEKLLTLMGVPFIKAPSEGEAQAAYMCAKGSVWAVGSQDYDSLLFGAPRLVRNLAITGKRKLPGRNVYVDVSIEIIELKEVLSTLELKNISQLIDMGILVGTDYNPRGIEGYGPKKALSLIKEFGSLKNAGIDVESYEEIFDIFINPKVTDDYELEWRESDETGIIDFLCGKFDFSEERVKKAISKLKAHEETKKQSQLDKWF